MEKDKWEVVYEAAGHLQADIIRGMLEAQEIPVHVSGEAVGRVFSFTVGPTARVQILVPVDDLPRARNLIEGYENESLADQVPADDDSLEEDG